MKTGQSLQAIATELQRQVETRKDYIVAQEAVEAKVVDGEVVVDGFNGASFPITPHAHGQLADHVGIPKKYYDRMLSEQPSLLAHNLNTWLHADGANCRMIRTLDGRARAFLSPKYRPLDNFDLAQVVLPKLLSLGFEVISAQLTATRFYLKGILPSLSAELPEGQTWGRGHHSVGRDGRLVSALVISNSEVGVGKLSVEPSVFTTWCTNLAVITEASMKKYHVGRAFDIDANLEIYRDETRKADDRAFWLKVEDVVEVALSEAPFKAAIAQIADAAKAEIVSPELPKVVEVAVRRLALPESTSGSILAHLARGGDLTQWGLSSAITATANDREDYEEATLLERAGGKVLALPETDWKAISTAA